MSTRSLDLVVVGSGPAGLAVAVAALSQGLRTALVAPDPTAPWAANYGSWESDIAATETPVARRWPRANVLGQGWSRSLDRAYVQIDRRRLQQRLLDQASAMGLILIELTATAVRHDPSGSQLRLTDGSDLTSRVVVDCGGHRPALLEPGHPAATAFQLAWGQRLRVKSHPWDPDEVVLMDWRPLPGRTDGPATFAYVLPFDEQHVFVEETVLAARLPPDPAFLEAELEARLHQHGITVVEVEEVERCVIPMNTPRPLPQRILALGGSAAMVHPATGYSVAHSLRSAPALARAIAQGLSEAGPERAAQLGWQAIWPPERVAAREVQQFGLEAILGLDAQGTDRFFRAFFQAEVAEWAPMMDAEASARQIAQVMLTMYRHADMPMRLGLSRAGFSAAGLRALRSLI